MTDEMYPQPYYKGYIITDGYFELHIAAETRSKATGEFIRRFAWHRIDWKQLRTRRYPHFDGTEPMYFDVRAFCTAEVWGVPVVLP